MKFEVVCGSDYTGEFESEIKSVLVKYPHTMDISADKNGNRFVFQSDCSVFQELKYKLLRYAVSYMLYFEKTEFYNKTLIKFLPSAKQFILARILIFSEFEQEVDAICKKMQDQSMVICDGIKNFMIKEYKNEWERVCRIINISSVDLKDSQNYKEFIKSMSCSISSKHSILYLFCGQRNILLSDKLEKIHSLYLNRENLNEEEKVVSALVENYPRNVAIYEETKGKMLNEALCVLFDARKTLKTDKKDGENS